MLVSVVDVVRGCLRCRLSSCNTRSSSRIVLQFDGHDGLGRIYDAACLWMHRPSLLLPYCHHSLFDLDPG
ncbi:hypothetical protein M758_3G217000 [Ceratodon purpureus]|nr:hypothetical protein M758_3G217000 [Ceratodon purpureus]